MTRLLLTAPLPTTRSALPRAMTLAAIVSLAHAGQAVAQPAATASPAAETAAVDGPAIRDSHPTIDKIISDYADSGIDGVVDIVKNKQGEITKMVVVGAAKITTVLGAADGLQTARSEARLRAVGKFRQFLEEKFPSRKPPSRSGPSSSRGTGTTSPRAARRSARTPRSTRPSPRAWSAACRCSDTRP